MKKILPLAFCGLSQFVYSQSEDEPYNKLFPVYGVTPGETTIEAITQRGFPCKKADDGKSISCHVKGLIFLDEDNNGIIESAYFLKIPYKWETYFGFDFNLSHDNWTKLLIKHGFTIEIISEPKTELYDNRKTFSARIKATSQTAKTEIELDFNYGNAHKEGFKSKSLRSLYAISIKSLGIEDAVYSVLEKKEDSEEEKTKLFPIYGITLGETSVKAITGLGYPCNIENRSDHHGHIKTKAYCDVKGLIFQDFNNDGIVESIHFLPYDAMPYKWEKYFGFDPNLSFDDWIRTLTKHGFIIDVYEQPHIELYDNRNTFSASLRATSVKHEVEISLDFNYGNNNNEGYSSTSLRSLFRIMIRTI